RRPCKPSPSNTPTPPGRAKASVRRLIPPTAPRVRLTMDSGYLCSLAMREVVLALLHGDGAHGYELKQALDGRFGDLLPALNAGQIYTTWARLARDELVTSEAVDGDARGKRVYRLTPAGRALLAEWIGRPVSGMRLKSEFLTKLVALAAARLAEPGRLIEDQ